MVWLVLDSIPLLVLFVVWVAVYQTQTTIKGYSLSQLLTYYWLGLLINGITGSHFESWRVQQIRDGKIDYYLTRPFSYLAEILCNDLGGKLCYLTFASIFFTALYAVLQHWLPFSWPPLSWTTGLLFFGLLVMGYIFEFMFGLIIVLLGFWFEGAEGLEHFKWITVNVLSGWMIPLAMMPGWLRTIVDHLPLRYMYAVPIGLWQGTTTFYPQDLFPISFFLASLIIVALLLWRAARYRYSSAGG